MKTAFNMIIYYLVATFLGLIVAAGIYMLCCDLTLLVAGEKLNFFNWDFFVRGLFVAFPLTVSVVLGFTIFYGIRHRENHFFRLGAYIFLCALTWFCLVPVCFNLQKSYEDKKTENNQKKLLSSGFFRPEAGGVFYFSRVEENGKSNGLFIDLSGITGEAGSIVRFFDSSVEELYDGKYSDTLIRDVVKLPLVLLVPLQVYSTLIENARSAWNSGWLSWISFLSFVLALCSVISFQYTSGWRLINALSVMFVAGVVCLVNYSFYKGFIFKNLRISWNEHLLAVEPGEKMNFIQKIFENSEPLLVAINLFLFAFILVFGILLFIFKYKNKKEAKQ